MNYLVVSPVKDEEQFIEVTLKAVIRQTIAPRRWLIVDDGSRDSTPAIIRRYAENVPWIRYVRIERDAARALGSAEIRAFTYGYELVCDEVPHDFVVKLDCDLDLPEDYFEGLAACFEQDRRLGIASGVYLQNDAGKWQPVKMPPYHAAGASKMIRTACYRDINGFILVPGWDTVDEIRARAMGWKTRHFEHLAFRHLKPEGSASGYLTTGMMHGAIDYQTGLSPLFVLFKAAQRMIKGNPPILFGASTLLGFVKSALLRRPKLISPHEQQLYRNLLGRRMAESVRAVLTHRPARAEQI